MRKQNWEREEQIAVANFLKCMRPPVLFTINAYAGTNRRTGGKMRASGYERGCPDIMVFEEGKVEAFKGLFIELKRSVVYGPSKVSDEQRRWIEELNKRGYKAVVAVGAQQAYAEIEKYFGLNRGEVKK